MRQPSPLGEKTSAPVAFRLPNEERAVLMRIARARGLRVSEVAREVVRAMLAQHANETPETTEPETSAA